MHKEESGDVCSLEENLLTIVIYTALGSIPCIRLGGGQLKTKELFLESLFLSPKHKKPEHKVFMFTSHRVHSTELNLAGGSFCV